MDRFLLSFVAVLGAVVLGSVSAVAEDEAPANAEEVFTKEVQAIGQAWQYSGVELPAGFTAAVSASGTWTINETWDKKVGAAGHPEYKGGDAYVKSGASEGGLLVRVGDTVLTFSKDDEVIKIQQPGRIYFCANDVATNDGLKRAELFVQGIPIQPSKDAHGNGFQDNEGALKVWIGIPCTNSSARFSPSLVATSFAQK